MPITTRAISSLTRTPISARHRGAARRQRARFGQGQAGDHFPELLARGDMGEADLADRLQVEQGQTLGEELAIDDALAEPGNDAETDAARQFVHRLADPA